MPFSLATHETSALQVVFLGGRWLPSFSHRVEGVPCKRHWVGVQVLPSPWLPLASVVTTIPLPSSRCGSDPPGLAFPRLQRHRPRSLEPGQSTTPRPPVVGGGTIFQHTNQPFQRHSLPSSHQPFSSRGGGGGVTELVPSALVLSAELVLAFGTLAQTQNEKSHLTLGYETWRPHQDGESPVFWAAHHTLQQGPRLGAPRDQASAGQRPGRARSQERGSGSRLRWQRPKVTDEVGPSWLKLSKHILKVLKISSSSI